MASDDGAHNPLRLEYKVNPPIGISTEAFMEVTASIEVTVQEDLELAPITTTLGVIHVGTPPSAERRQVPADLTAAGTLDHGALKIHIFNTLGDPSADGLKAAFGEAIGPTFGQGTLARRVVLIVHSLGAELLPIVSGGVSQIVEKGVVLDVVAGSSDIDFRAWERIAHDGRGHFIVPREKESVEQAISTYREDLCQRRVCEVNLELTLSPQLRYVRAFWSGKEPSFLLDREPAEMSLPLRLSVPPEFGRAGSRASWLLVCIVPRRRSGRYQIIEMSLNTVTPLGSQTTSLNICHEVSTQPNDARLVDASVGALYARVRPCFWVEELGQALSHEDGARILNLYDPFIRWAREEERTALVDALWTAKRAFQRGGYFGTRQLNEFWRMAHQGLPG